MITMDQGGDGLILCLDLNSPDGATAAERLAHRHSDVADAVRHRDHGRTLRYLLGLLPASAQGRGVVVLASPATLSSAIRVIRARARDFGGSYTMLIVPPSPETSRSLAGLSANI